MFQRQFNEAHIMLSVLIQVIVFNPLRPEQNGHYFAGDITNAFS